MLTKNFRLKLDLSNDNLFEVPNIKFNLMDTESSAIYVQLLNEGKEIDVDNVVVVLYISKPDGTEVVLQGEFEDPSTGLVRFILPKQALVLASKNYNAEIRVTKDGRCIVSRDFSYTVLENLSSNDKQLLSSNDYIIFVDALNRLTHIETNEDSRVRNEEARIVNDNIREENVLQSINKINAKVSEVDKTKTDFETVLNNKRNMVDTKITEFTSTMDSIENRFNALSPTLSSNAEVQLARTDITGFEHASLKNRIDRIESNPSIVWETVEG